MTSDIERILLNSDKGEALEAIKTELMEKEQKGIIIFVSHEGDDMDWDYTIHVKTLSLSSKYEAYGILEAAKWALQQDDILEEEDV